MNSSSFLIKRNLTSNLGMRDLIGKLFSEYSNRGTMVGSGPQGVSAKERHHNPSLDNHKILQTFANLSNNMLTSPQVWQPLASSGKQSPFSRYSSNDGLITTAHKMGHVG